MRVRSVGLLAVFALIVASCGGGVPEAAGPSEGIQVHGDWTIDIYNEDGTLDEHFEFSNALVPSGAQLLAEILRGLQVTSGSWKILASKHPLDPGDSPCGTVGASVDCEVTGSAVSADLPGDGRLILSGSFVADIDGSIALVGTQLSHCGSSDPSPCTEDFTDFTETGVATPSGVSYRVDAGQQVELEVEFSFTSG